jgi:hypothetical protein
MSTVPGPVEPRTAAVASLVAVGTAIATIFADWVTVRVQIPLGVLLVLFVFIILPTGDLLRLLSELIDAARPKKKRKQEEFRPYTDASRYAPRPGDNPHARNGERADDRDPKQ